MDVHCCNCGEPWDQYYLRHELGDNPHPHVPCSCADYWDKWKFGENRLVVLHCPACPQDRSPQPGLGGRAEVVQELASLLGDDLDGLASTLDDFGL